MELYCFGVEKAQRKQQREKSADSEQFRCSCFFTPPLLCSSFFASSLLSVSTLCCFPPHETKGERLKRERSALKTTTTERES
jgi:hypothetical protein